MVSRRAHLRRVSRYRVSNEDDPDDPDEIDAPTIEQVESFVRSLDGRKFDQVAVELEMVSGSKARLAVEGGYEAATLTITDPNLIHCLFNPGAPRGQETSVWSGGVRIERESNRVVPLDVVIAATHIFLETGRLDDSFSWYAHPSVIRRGP
jgi:hypothetical protein